MCVRAQDSWQISGNWKKDKKLKDDEDFGKGRLGVRPRKIDPLKAMEMDLDPFTSNHVKVSSVEGGNAPHRP